MARGETEYALRFRFNPSRGIAIIQTKHPASTGTPPSCFNPSRGIAIIQTWRAISRAASAGFNPSRGIAIIQTAQEFAHPPVRKAFQSLTRDSNHSNFQFLIGTRPQDLFQSLTRDSNHSNPECLHGLVAPLGVSIPHAG